MKKRSMILPLILCILVLLSACAPNTVEQAKEPTAPFTDSCGRTVQLPERIERMAVTGSTAQMILSTLAPELLVAVASRPEQEQQHYLPDCLSQLPELGQLYGGKGNLNMESLIRVSAQVIIDLGDQKADHAADMQAIQEQTGIPTVFIRTSGDELAQAYRTLGRLLDREERAEELAQYIEETYRFAEESRARVTEAKTVLFCTGVAGLDCNQRGSVQAVNIERVGGINALVSDTFSNKSGGCSIDYETLLSLNPDVILLTPEGFYDLIWEDSIWNKLSAVQGGRVYEIPGLPYGWMSNPPSVNQVLGIYWLGNLLYPEIYDYDMADKAQEFFRLFWQYELTEEEAASMLSRSTLKNQEVLP